MLVIMKDLWQYLKTSDKPILLYGMGNGAEKLLDLLEKNGVTASGVFCSDGFVRDKVFRGFKLCDYSTAKNTFGDMIVLTAFGTQLPDVMDNIKRIAGECELYVPDLPVVGEGVFDTEFAKLHAEDIRFVYDRLADEQSKRVFCGIIENKITGSLSSITDCETDVFEAYENIIKPDSDGVFVDLGAYRGDTVFEYLRFAGGAKKIYAVEPDAKTFKKLSLIDIPYMTAYNVAISDSDGIALFDTQNGRNSKLDKCGKPLPTRSVDSILKGNPCDYIKMDVEGAESLAINGARNTILNFKPRMCIATYHRTEDIFAIPKQVLSINPDYKVYLRHFPYIPAWDTNYYFI